MTFSRMIGIAVLCLGMAGCLEAQTDTPEAIFSNAYVLEADSSADAAQNALAEYERVIALSPDGAIGVRARVAAARCLRKLGKIDAAQAMLAAAKKIATTDEPAKKELDIEAKELAQAAAAKTDGGPIDDFEKRIVDLCAMGRNAEVVGLGRSALPTLLKIIERRIAPSNPAAILLSTSNAARIVILGGYQEGVDLLLKLMAEKRDIVDRSAVVTTMADAFLGNGRQNEVFYRFVRLQTPLLRALLADQDPLVRSTAARFMQEIDGVTIDDYTRALNDEILDVRKYALASATSNYTRVAAKDREVILRIAVKDSVAVVRAEVAEQIGRLRREGNAKLAEELVDILMRDRDALVRIRAVQRGANSSEPQTRTLARRAMQDEDPQVRAAGVYALSATSQDIPELRRLLADKDPQLTQRVQQLLSNFPPEQVLDSPEAEREMVAALKSASENARQFAHAVLARTGSKAVAADVTAALSGGTEPEHRCAIYYSIRHDLIEQFPRILPILPGITGSGVPYGNQVSVPTRQSPSWNDGTGNAVVEWLKTGKRSKELMSLVGAYDKFPQTQSNFRFESLLGSTIAVTSDAERPALLDVILKIEDLDRRAMALDFASPKLGAEAFAMAAYEAALTSPNRRLRASAARHLAKFGSPDVTGTLVRALIAEKDSETAAQIGRAVASRSTNADLGALEKAYLESTDSSVRYTIVTTIEKIDAPEVNTVLLRLLEASEVPGIVFEVLGRRKVADSMPKIRAWLGTERAASDEGSRHRAIEALGRLGDVDAIDLLVSILAKLPHDRAWGDDFQLEVVPEKENQGRIFLHPAYIALHEINQSRLVDVVRQTILPGKFDTSIKRQGVLMMTWIAKPEATRLILETMESGSNELKAAAARAAGEALLGSTASALRDLVRSPDKDVRMEAERALRRMVSLGVPIP
jgi:HEAT repeat protein